MILFLTDGRPGGTAGKDIDIDNEKINGVNEVAALKQMKGVTIYACGVGINKFDMNGASRRLNAIDSSGTATYARYINEFDDLKSTILQRLNQEYEIDIRGKYGFYQDTLSDVFTLDETKLDDSWAVLDATDNIFTIQGIPKDVLNAAQGKKAVYVKDTKTVYWHVGDLTNGTVEEKGHTFDYAVKYKDYRSVTDGMIKSISLDTKQKMTYLSTQNPVDVLSVSVKSPAVLFSRDANPTITVEKTIPVSQSDNTMKFVYGKTKCNDVVTDVIDTVSLVIPKGKTKGSVVFSNVSPGTYYVYEVDDKNQILSNHVQEVTVSESSSLVTDNVGNIPKSALSSNDVILDNLDNVLTISTKSSVVSFEDSKELIDVDVRVNWIDENYKKRPEKVIVWLLKDGEKYDSVTLGPADDWKHQFKDVDKYDENGKECRYSVIENEVLQYTSKAESLSNLSHEITNTLLYGTVRIKKFENDSETPLAGVTFELQRKDDFSVVATGITDSNGELIFSNVYPDSYQVVETKTVKGHDLLKDVFYVDIPKQLTSKELIELEIDKEKCVYYSESDVYFIYDFTYEVTNHVLLSMPDAGGVVHWFLGFFFVIMSLAFAGAAIFLVRKKKRLV